MFLLVIVTLLLHFYGSTLLTFIFGGCLLGILIGVNGNDSLVNGTGWIGTSYCGTGVWSLYLIEISVSLVST